METATKLQSGIFHTAIIGAGASGLFCAGSFKAHKIVLEANHAPACKVAVSGGGKCNFSNRFISAANYESQNKHFCKSALAAFTPKHFTDLLDARNIPWEERSQGRLFAKNAKDIVRFLVKRARENNTYLALDTRVLEIKKQNGEFILSTSAGIVRAQHVVLASGGLSFPALGGNSFGIKIARQFGLNIQPQRPVLCGLSFPKDLRAHFALLAGNSLP
ncbi:MAG: NAD(P)/FAD-dependent oxidoreductase, partial [Elusimicrobiaceae bacterium]|nr:NAD(P)/FAD-dependent oxidoreductase [Elusimicrobiaceae bacterium]